VRSRAAGETSVSDLLQSAGILGLGVLTALLCVLAVQHTRADPPIADGTASGPQVGSSASASLEPRPTATATPAASSAQQPPDVRDQRRADFTAGDRLPDGSRIFDSSTVSGMAIRDGALSHGRPAGRAAASYLETRLAGDVAKLGARVVFPQGSSGSVALVAWPASVVEAGLAGAPLPESGMRLVVTPGSWKLVSGGQREVVAEGEFEVAVGQPVTIEVARDGATVWVSDPEGLTSIDHPAAIALAGPWACWALLETSADQIPASIQAVWAGLRSRWISARARCSVGA
jgi:hypothetical protein